MEPYLFPSVGCDPEQVTHPSLNVEGAGDSHEVSPKSILAPGSSSRASWSHHHHHHGHHHQSWSSTWQTCIEHSLSPGTERNHLHGMELSILPTILRGVLLFSSLSLPPPALREQQSETQRGVLHSRASREDRSCRDSNPVPVSGVSASGGARKTGPDSAHPGPQSSLAGRHAGLRSSSATRRMPAAAPPRRSRHPGRENSWEGSAGWEVEQGPLSSGTAPPTSRGGGRKRASALREEEGVPSNWGAMPTQREALERPLSPSPFTRSGSHPPTPSKHPFYRWFARGRERERSCSPPHLQT